jgi:hypothetical protein
MRDNYPSAVSRFLNSFGKHAKRLIAENPNRNENIEARVAEQIFAAWEHNQAVPLETKQTTFLRDYFNVFWEVVLACDNLETVRSLIQKTVEAVPSERELKIVTYWSEAYLNDIYIFEMRMFDFLTASERRYGKDRDFAEPVRKICGGIREQVQEALEPLIKIRGSHVHTSRSRHSDPQLVRLAHLELLVSGLGIDELSDERKKASHEARQWLIQQTDYYTKLAWTLLDSTCEVLAVGIVTENDWLIVPVNYKDTPLSE